MHKTLNIILFNDDNHAPRVWIEGVCVGNLDYPEQLFSAINQFYQARKYVNYIDVRVEEVYTGDEDFYDMDENLFNEIYNWFEDVEYMLEEEVQAVLNRDWNKWNEFHNKLESLK